MLLCVSNIIFLANVCMVTCSTGDQPVTGSQRRRPDIVGRNRWLQRQQWFATTMMVCGGGDVCGGNDGEDDGSGSTVVVCCGDDGWQGW